MAFCQTCGLEFLTSPEEERLIITKAIPEVCMACAMSGIPQEEDPLLLPMLPLAPRRRFVPDQIIRVDLRNPSGDVVSFISLEPGPYFPKHRERKRPIHRPRVTILGNPNRGNEPMYISIITNIENFEKEDRDLFAMKVPSAYDARSGLARSGSIGDRWPLYRGRTTAYWPPWRMVTRSRVTIQSIWSSST